MIDAISGAIAQTPGCVLLDVDAGPSTNRTVYTFVGQPQCVVQGALNAARTAWRLIDMSKHQGEGVIAGVPLKVLPGPCVPMESGSGIVSHRVGFALTLALGPWALMFYS